MVAGLNPWSYALTQCEVIVHYLRLALWPHPLVFDYAWPIADPLSSVVPSAAVVLACSAAPSSRSGEGCGRGSGAPGSS